MPSAAEIIDALNLQPLPDEGGYYRETWKLPSSGSQPAGTAILYLITPESFSALHRLDADEIFHHYLGDPCEQVVIDRDGQLTTSILGPNVLGGQRVQTVVPKENWQGTKLLEGGDWALVGTTMAPGYHHGGFELATVDDLRDLCPHVKALATSYLADGA